MKQKLFFISTFLVVLLFAGCSSQMPEIKKVDKISDGIYGNDLRINIKRIYAWVNHLPNSKPRFQISGSIEVFDNSKYDYNELKISKVYVYQKDEELFRFIPKSRGTIEDNKKVIAFSTIKGLLLTPILDIKSTVNLRIDFTDGINNYSYPIKNIAIEEVY